MVLSDADPSSPNSDNDRFSFSSDSNAANADIESNRIRIDTRGMPRPFTLGGIFSGRTTQQMANRIFQERVQTTAKLLHRKVTVDEATAHAFWAMKSVAISSYGPPAGILWACYRTYKTRASYKFPFFRTPHPESFNPNKFFGLAQGQVAQTSWHITRLFCYGTVGVFIGGTLFTLYAAMSTTIGHFLDPRLKEHFKAMQAYLTELQQKSRTEGGQGRGRRVPQPLPQRAEASSEQSESEIQELWKKQQNAIGGGDDASPTSGYNYEQDRPSYAQSGDGMLSDQQMRSQEQQQQKPRLPQRQPRKPTATFEAEKDDFQGSSFDAFDDASPTARQDSANTNSGTGSRWERIRNQGNSPSQGTSTPPRGSINRRPRTSQERTESSSPAGDSFTFSDTETDRQLAKSEAQKEFDERVERERRGGDFSSGGRRS